MSPKSFNISYFDAHPGSEGINFTTAAASIAVALAWHGTLVAQMPKGIQRHLVGRNRACTLCYAMLEIDRNNEKISKVEERRGKYVQGLYCEKSKKGQTLTIFNTN